MAVLSMKIDQLLSAAQRLQKRGPWLLAFTALMLSLSYYLAITSVGLPLAIVYLATCALLLTVEVIFLLGFALGFIRIPYLKEENQKRQWAKQARGRVLPEEKSLVTLATPQPAADAEALVLPTVIQYRDPWFLVLAAGLGLFGSTPILVFFLIYVITSIYFPAFFQFVSFPAFILGIAMSALYIGVFLLVHLVRLTRPVGLEITEAGISRRIGRSEKKHFVAWSEVHLFALAIHPGAFLRRRSPLFYYEMEGKGTAVRWLASLERYRGIARSPQAGEMSPEEYQCKMQALLAVIAAKTGLPLYDLC